MCTFNGICTSPVILLGNQALASPSKFPESRNVECSSDLVVSGWPMIFQALLSICGHDFLTPLQNWKILGRHQEEPWKNNIPIPFFGSFFFERKTWKEQFCQIRKNLLVVCMIHLLEKRSDVMVTGEEKTPAFRLDGGVFFFGGGGGRGRIGDGKNFKKLGPKELLEVGD